MRKFLVGGFMASLMAAASPANATTILSVTNAPVIQIPLATLFVATGPTTLLTFGGYQLPSYEQVTGISVTVLFGSTANLLHKQWQYTPAPSGAAADQFFNVGGVNGIEFGGITIGSYDLFSQSFTTVVGQTYELNFLFTQDFAGPNGLKITVNEPITIIAKQSAVPESATWAMMLTGFGMIGFGLRRGRKTVAAEPSLT